MDAISETKNGKYQFIKNLADIKISFADILGELISTYATNIDLDIISSEYVKITTIYNNKEVYNNYNSIKIDNLKSGIKKDIVLKLKVDKSYAIDENKI